MRDFWKNEWRLFLEDLTSVKNLFSKIFGNKKEYLMLNSGSEVENEGNMLNQSQIQVQVQSQRLD